MRILLRSLFTSGPSDSRKLFNRNFSAVSKTDLVFPISEHQEVYEYIRDFFRANGHVPDITTLISAFTRNGKIEVVDQLEQIKADTAVTRGDFSARLNTKIEDRKKLEVRDLLADAREIASTGKKITRGKGQEEFIVGPEAAVRFVIDHSHNVLKPTGSVKLSGEVHSDIDDYLKEYETRKQDEMLGMGQHTGIEQMDVVLRGAKKKELWCHSAFTGHLKSTLALNWTYTQSVFYHHDVLYFSLEMPYEQCRRNYYAMHSFHDDFTDVRIDLGLQEIPEVPRSLDYRRIRDAELTAIEEKFFLDYVLEDLRDPAKEYGKVHFEVADPDKPSFTVRDMQLKAEMIYAKQPFSMIIVDHALLVSPQGRYNNRTDQANEVMRDLKKLSMSFFRGTGMAIVVLFQMSRDGYRKAYKRGGLYDLTALSYSNEIERSSDVITASWCEGAMKQEGRVMFQCLKTRDNEPFKPFLARIEWPCKRLLTCYEDFTGYMSEEQRKKVIGDTENTTVEDLSSF